jgi:hypothetical protein
MLMSKGSAARLDKVKTDIKKSKMYFMTRDVNGKNGVTSG